MLQAYDWKSGCRGWLPPVTDKDGASGTAMAKVLIASGVPWSKLRQWARRRAREADKPLVTVALSALRGSSWRERDREINRLFSHPKHREAIIVIRAADLLSQIAEDPNSSYLLARIAAHRGTIVLDTSLPPSAFTSTSCFDIEVLDID